MNSQSSLLVSKIKHIFYKLLTLSFYSSCILTLIFLYRNGFFSSRNFEFASNPCCVCLAFDKFFYKIMYPEIREIMKWFIKHCILCLFTSINIKCCISWFAYSNYHVRTVQVFSLCHLQSCVKIAYNNK